MTAPSLRDRIARALHDEGAYCGNCGYEAAFDQLGCLDCQQALYGYADAVMGLLADADPTDLGYELVGWQLPWGGFHDAGWVPHYEHDLCTPVYARPRPEETPDA